MIRQHLAKPQSLKDDYDYVERHIPGYEKRDWHQSLFDLLE